MAENAIPRKEETPLVEASAVELDEDCGQVSTELFDRAVLLGIFERAIGIERFMRPRHRHLRREHEDVDVAEHHPEMDKAPKAAQGSR